MTLERGDVVAVSDPFDDNETRPFVVVNTDDHPFHGEQYVALTLTTRTWFDGTLPLTDDDFVEGGVPEDSFVVPWASCRPERATSANGSAGSSRPPSTTPSRR
ncbi:hypothetical protein [Halosimplex salinum]|uniref:hypothetical protein n=1 Tax=Halosimplex salinum TaxID=1710538 RepID=UPI0019D279E4|nr:hypothetical protein [Halosimplex salinum]